jgi:hypothetical protein
LYFDCRARKESSTAAVASCKSVAYININSAEKQHFCYIADGSLSQRRFLAMKTSMQHRCTLGIPAQEGGCA